MASQLKNRIKGRPEITKIRETDENTVYLAWRETSGAEQYIIEKYDPKSESFQKIARVGEDVLDYTDAEVEVAKVYTYRIAAKRKKDDGGVMIRRGASQNVTLADPHQVRLLEAAHPQFGVAVLSWERDDTADGYRVNRRPSSVHTPLPLSFVEGQTLCYTDDTLVSGQVYYYCVQSYRRAEDDELIFSRMGEEKMVVNLDRTEILEQKRSPGRGVAFSVRVTAAIDSYVLFRADEKDGDYKEVFRSKNGLDLKLTDKGERGKKGAYYCIKCMRRYQGEEYYSEPTDPVYIKYEA